MPHVSVTINGRQYRMACDEGQEHHLARLAHELDQRIARLRTTFGEIGDMRLTVMAALLISDELAVPASTSSPMTAQAHHNGSQRIILASFGAIPGPGVAPQARRPGKRCRALRS